VIKRNYCYRFACPTSSSSLWISVLFHDMYFTLANVFH